MTESPVGALTARSLCEAFQDTVARHPDLIALRTPGGGTEITWFEYGERVKRIAAGLAAIGVGQGDTVGLMMLNRPETALVDTAALHLGAIPFSVYNSSSPEQLSYLLADAGNRVIVTQQTFLGSVRACGADLTVISVDGGDGTVSLADLEAKGDPSFDFDSVWREVGPDDVLILIYTSGTTGPPKGVELTHGSILAQLTAQHARLPVRPGDRIASYLPTAHVADRWSAHYMSMAHGMTVTYVDDPKGLAAALPDIRPTIWGGVPRVLEKFKAALEAKGIVNPTAVPAEARTAVLQALGLDQVRWAVCGAAPVAPEVITYFRDLGVPVGEIWGMSEISCLGTVNPPEAVKVGSVGIAMDGVELRLAEDGELLLRGPILMRGYRNKPEKTAEAIDDEGWLHTGDVATIDEEGYVRIVDRKKELIINAAGKNMSPANIEQILKTAHPLIGQAAVIGDRRPYNVALLVLDPDVGAAYAEQHGLDAATATLAQDPGVLVAVAAAVEAANARMSRVEQIKKYRILDVDWLPGGDELTPTMKLRRKPIEEKYADLIEALYSD